MIRDLLMRLAIADLVQGKWTTSIHEEWIRALQRNRPDLPVSNHQRVKELMEKALPDAKVSNYEQLIASLELPDQDDRHVLAAAIHCKADLIITFNLKDFPAEILKHYKLKAQHPDEVACMLLERSPNQVIEVVKDQLKSLRNPPKSMRQMLADFEQRGLEAFPQLILEYL